jgi:hypothetical protein
MIHECVLNCLFFSKERSIWVLKRGKREEDDSANQCPRTRNSACCRDRTGLDGLDDDIHYNEITERAENDLTPSWHTGVISSRPMQQQHNVCVFFFSFCPQVVQSHFIVFGMTIFQACWSAIKTYGCFLQHYSFISFAHPFIKKNGCDDQLQRPTLWFLHSGFQGFNGKITTFKSYSVCDVANGKLFTQLDGHELCLPFGRPRCCHASQIQPSTPSFYILTLSKKNYIWIPGRFIPTSGP